MRARLTGVSLLVAASLLVGGAASPTTFPAPAAMTPPPPVRSLLMTEHGDHPVFRLTSGPGNDMQPSFSPDGSRVVFLSDRDGQMDVFSVAFDGTGLVNLTQTPGRQEDTPRFSPDGRSIVYASNDTPNGDWDLFLMAPDGSNRRIAVGHVGTDELHPSFSRDGRRLYFSSNLTGSWDLYEAYIAGPSVTWPTWVHLGDGPAADRYPALSPDGSTIVFRSERDGNSEIYVMDAAPPHRQRRLTEHPAFDYYVSYLPDMSGILFDSNRFDPALFDSYLINPAGAGIVPLKPDLDWQVVQSSVSPDGAWRAYAARPTGSDYDLYVESFVSPLLRIGLVGAASSGDACAWESGVLALGWARAWQVTGDARYFAWLRAYVDRCIPGAPVAHVNDGLLAYAALIVYGEEPREDLLRYAREVAVWMLDAAPRTPDGTLIHLDGQVWSDTLIGVGPFLAEMSRVTGDDLYRDEAVRQIVGHANRLQDPLTGLFRHGWDAEDEASGEPAFWSRGNGWAIAGTAVVLESLPRDHPQYSTILNIFRDHAAGLKAVQNGGGLWHCILDAPDSFPETSGAALIGFGFEQGLSEGWLEASEYGAACREAQLALWEKVLADGTLLDVGAPTGVQADPGAYAAVPHDRLQLYGQGAALLFLSPPRAERETR